MLVFDISVKYLLAIRADLQKHFSEAIIFEIVLDALNAVAHQSEALVELVIRGCRLREQINQRLVFGCNLLLILNPLKQDLRRILQRLSLIRAHIHRIVLLLRIIVVGFFCKYPSKVCQFRLTHLDQN